MTRRRIILLMAILILIISASIGGHFILSRKKDNVQKELKPFGHQALKINGNFISSDIFISERNIFFEKYKRNAEMMQKTDEERNDMLLDQIIENIILDDYAFEKSGIIITEEEIDEYISRFVDTRYEKSTEKNQFMASRGYKDEMEMREDIKEYILKNQLFYSAAASYSISINEGEFKEKYNEHKMQNKKVDYKHIFISTDDIDKEAALTKAKNIYESLLEGEEFEKMAQNHSDNEETSENGGLVNDATFARTHPEINRYVFSAQANQLLEPIEISKGFEVVYVERIVEYFRTEEEYKEMMIVNEFLASDKYSKWIEQLKEEYEIEILDPELKAYRFYRDEDYENAANMYEKLYKDIGNDYYIVRAADSYKKAEKWAELIRISEDALKKDSSNVINYLNSAIGYYKSNNEKKALKLLQKAEKISGDNLYLQTMVNETYEMLGITQNTQD